jgi:hypothetical protein
MSPWRQADHNGRDERLTYLSCDVLREAIYPPVGLPPTMEGGDGYALQEVKLIKCTAESPQSYALILRIARGGQALRVALSTSLPSPHSPWPMS